MKFSLEGKLLKGLRQYRKLIQDYHWWNRQQEQSLSRPPFTTDFVRDSDRKEESMRSSYKPRLTGEY